MKLNEKIILCRKKQGLSQSDLADLLNVSRQSVSKWETGEAKPDIDKLMTLSRVFDVSTDWLLDENKNEEEKVVETNNDFPEWINKLPKSVGLMVKKYGWIYGVYASLGGFIFILFGYFVRKMAISFIGPSTDDFYINEISNSSLELFEIFSNLIIIIGVAVVVFNLGMAIILRIWGKKK